MLRYIQRYIRTTWHRWFSSVDEREEMQLIAAFEEHCIATRYVSYFSVNPHRQAELVNACIRLKNYIIQYTPERNEKISYPSVPEEAPCSHSPEVSSIKLRMHYFLLMCLDDV